ncbi:nuclear transport factor 2 family protein [Mycolicibacterium brumae]|uniref:Steroid delta-isomerase n=1 Tax=Mycolicibacterium brumae TaxID=85968 RepID=A0A2G5PEQ1_9MYCO|nr:nuclear transport factor 2 family protein [Mycolicibacterium brumae]MCV7191998.1 nuclear transport factor 2 family protein [Mycolicibacterium brumae]PIB76797.1 steroid delta-isomerase [Mycolicibacterium brumae]RWA20668.1 hypothetical protein MBRU_03135 [Mycolicibacterium brumae DSM 44177]UWW07764.1 nuclear transport factor 2 family protein [Mycolicibacterium brumae]
MTYSVDTQALVRRYLHTVNSGTAADVAALYAEDATVADPVGSGEVHIGRRAIEGFYSGLAAAEVNTELLTFRDGGHEAAFMFEITVGDKFRVQPIEVMTFDRDGLITSMKAYWTPADVIS